jgi:hypothetical protein
MYYLTYALLLAGAFILITSTVSLIKEFLQRRREEAAPFREYFGSARDADLRQLSSSSEAEDWSADRLPRFTPFRLRVLDLNVRKTAVGSSNRGNRDSN